MQLAYFTTLSVRFVFSFDLSLSEIGGHGILVRASALMINTEEERHLLL